MFLRDDGSCSPSLTGARTPTGAVREGDWKLIEFFADDHVELYSLALDPGEQYDLSSSFSANAEDLCLKLYKWRASVNAAMPSRNPEYDPALALLRTGAAGCSADTSRARLED